MIRWLDHEMMRWWDDEVMRWWDDEVMRWWNFTHFCDLMSDFDKFLWVLCTHLFSFSLSIPRWTSNLQSSLWPKLILLLSMPAMTCCFCCFYLFLFVSICFYLFLFVSVVRWIFRIRNSLISIERASYAYVRKECEYLSYSLIYVSM
jgi:hypothetical protein